MLTIGEAPKVRWAKLSLASQSDSLLTFVRVLVRQTALCLLHGNAKTGYSISNVGVLHRRRMNEEAKKKGRRIGGRIKKKSANCRQAKGNLKLLSRKRMLGIRLQSNHCVHFVSRRVGELKPTPQTSHNINPVAP